MTSTDLAAMKRRAECAEPSCQSQYDVRDLVAEVLRLRALAGGLLRERDCYVPNYPTTMRKLALDLEEIFGGEISAEDARRWWTE